MEGEKRGEGRGGKGREMREEGEGKEERGSKGGGRKEVHSI